MGQSNMSELKPFNTAGSREKHVFPRDETRRSHSVLDHIFFLSVLTCLP